VLARARLALGRDLTLGTFLDRTAAVRGGRRLVEQADRSFLDHRSAAERVDRWAGVIDRRIERGGRVVIATPNTYDQFLIALAACRAGGIAVPVNPEMRRDEIRHVVRDAGADLVVRDVDEIAGGDPLGRAADPDPSATAVLFYTSGTTGRPKGVELSHRSLLRQVTAGAFWPGMGRDDEAVVSLPIAHIMGFVTLLGMAAAGIPVWFLPRFRPVEVLDAIEERRSSLFVGVPAMFRLLEEAGAAERDLTSVRAWICGADAMPADLAKRFKGYGATATLPVVGPVGEAAFVEGYGMVEVAGGVATKISPPMLDVGLGDSLGIPLPGYHFKVVGEDDRPVAPGQEGELWIRGPGLLRGYWGTDGDTGGAVTEDGWLRTGDLARRGVLGTAVFAGRKKDVILNGGYTVYAREVEAVLEEHPDGVEAAVAGRPDRRTGEVPVAAVRLAEGAEVDAEGLRAWAAEQLADYKTPRALIVVDDLPRTGTQKLRRQELLALFE
jgi:acyl-CoA synthetase (AMP-forming)/AMP-acid ligase II